MYNLVVKEGYNELKGFSFTDLDQMFVFVDACIRAGKDVIILGENKDDF